MTPPEYYLTEVEIDFMDDSEPIETELQTPEIEPSDNADLIIEPPEPPLTEVEPPEPKFIGPSDIQPDDDDNEHDDDDDDDDSELDEGLFGKK